MAVATAVARRDELLDAADRVIRRDGPATSMAAVAAEAGVSKPILYRHFGDKGGLSAALAERHTPRLLDALTASLTARGSRETRVRRTVDAYLAAIEREPQLYRFLTSEAGSPVRAFTDALVDRLARGLALELGADGVRERAWAHGIVGMVQAAGDWWLDTAPCPREALAAHLTDLLLGAYGS